MGFFVTAPFMDPMIVIRI